MPLEHPTEINAMQPMGMLFSACGVVRSKAMPNAYVAIAPISSTWPESLLSVSRMKRMTHATAKGTAAKSARKREQAFDGQSRPFDMLRVTDNRNPRDLQGAGDGASDCRAVCRLWRYVAHLNSLHARFEGDLPMRSFAFPFASISFSRANTRIAIFPMTK